MHRILLFILVFCPAFLNAQNIRVGLFSDKSIKEMEGIVGKGTYFVFKDSIQLAKLGPADIFKATYTGGLVRVMVNGVEKGRGKSIRLIQDKQEDYLQVRLILPAAKQRSYEGDFDIEIRKEALNLVNNLDMETYLEGVVESEGGPGQKLNYYKAQAVISRTYAMKYWSKHKENGYNLCDRVHCQAYLHHRSATVIIDSAVHQTRGLVMIDQAGDLYPTYFHANCGGQTSEPHYVWNEEIPNLCSFKDTFCIHTKQAKWEKRIPKEQWTKFLVDKYDFPIGDSVSYELLQHFVQEQRSAFYLHPIYGIPLRDLREQFKLKSTFFDIEMEGEEMVLHGRGFGHGVGLCQEGAMNMAKKGYSFDQILGFYYPEMRMIERTMLIYK
jgi:stage II sporulation protein D